MINDVFFITSFYSTASIFVLWNDINKKKEDVKRLMVWAMKREMIDEIESRNFLTDRDINHLIVSYNHP
jgi:hypothetical protein